MLYVSLPILDHLSDYFDLTGNTFINHTDELGESMHLHIHKRLAASNYVVRNIKNPLHGEKLLSCVIHHNSYAINCL